ncbi:MAG: hypothetical protein ABMB14_15205, partial [Myxococcota bacterium]
MAIDRRLWWLAAAGGCSDPLWDTPLEVVDGASVCGVAVRAGDAFVLRAVEPDGDDGLTAVIDQLGDLSGLGLCTVDDGGAWALTLAGIDAHGAYDATLAIDDAEDDATALTLTVDRWCAGPGCRGLEDSGASVTCAGSAAFTARAPSDGTSGSASDVR